MKNINTFTCIAGMALMIMLSGPLSALGQAEIGRSLGSSGSTKTTEEAVGQSVINTIMPIGVGIGAVHLFENNTVQSIGASLAVYGLIMGPSTGNFYANDYLRGGLGALTRIGAAFLLKDATREVFGSKFSDALHVDNESVSLEDTEIIVGGALMLGTIAYNILSAPASVREYNNSRRSFSLKLETLPGTNQTAPMLTTRFQL